MNNKYRNIALSVVFCMTVTISGCATKTRLGALIPAHEYSDQSKQETILINYHSGTGNKIAPLAASGAMLVAGLAVDFVKKELEKEAEKYETQFEKTLWLSTSQLAEGENLIYLSRWVDDKTLNFGDQKTKGGAKASYEQILNEWKTYFPKDAPKVEGKQLAFLCVVQIDQRGQGGPYTVMPKYLWSWKTKAKVVDFSLKEGWKIWTWLGGLLLKTDSTVLYDINLKVDALVKTKDSQIPIMVEVPPTGSLLKGYPHNLDKPSRYDFEDRNGGWFDIPEYKNGAGYFTVKIAVTEKDASNTKKYVKEAAEEIGKNKDSILKKLSEVLGQKK